MCNALIVRVLVRLHRRSSGGGGVATGGNDWHPGLVISCVDTEQFAQSPCEQRGAHQHIALTTACLAKSPAATNGPIARDGGCASAVGHGGWVQRELGGGPQLCPHVAVQGSIDCELGASTTAVSGKDALLHSLEALRAGQLVEVVCREAQRCYACSGAQATHVDAPVM